MGKKNSSYLEEVIENKDGGVLLTEERKVKTPSEKGEREIRKYLCKVKNEKGKKQTVICEAESEERVRAELESIGWQLLDAKFQGIKSRKKVTFFGAIKRLFFGLIALALLGFIGKVVIDSVYDAQNKIDKAGTYEKQYDYNIVAKERFSRGRLGFKVTVPKGTSPRTMFKVAKDIVSHHTRNPNSIRVWIWEEGMSVFKTSPIYQVEWDGPGRWKKWDYTPDLNVTEVATRFSEKERQEIYREISSGEDKAAQEAEAKYPDDHKKRAKEYRNLSKNYRRYVLSSYDINEKEWELIMKEGVAKRW